MISEFSQISIRNPGNSNKSRTNIEKNMKPSRHFAPTKTTVSSCILCPCLSKLQKSHDTWPTKDPDSLISEVDETGAEKLLGSQEMEVDIFWMINMYIYLFVVCMYIHCIYIQIYSRCICICICIYIYI